MSSITSEEVNYLIYRYFQEAGFVHSAFCFGQESFIESSNMKPSLPPGELVLLLQKGLYYSNLEYHLRHEDGTIKECGMPFNLLEKHSCYNGEGGGHKQCYDDEEIDVGTQKITPLPSSFSFEMDTITKKEEKSVIKVLKNSSDSDEAFSTIFNGDGKGGKSLLAFALSKGIAQIYLCDAENDFTLLYTLRHPTSSDITSMCWSPDGSILTTGCQDGSIWNWLNDLLIPFPSSLDNANISNDGSELKTQHKGPISKLAWSPNGTMLLSASSKPALCLWSISGEKGIMKLLTRIDESFSSSVDVSWSWDSNFFASASSKKIIIYSVVSQTASQILELNTHSDDVNSISFDSSSHFLLSSSDDHTAIVWKLYSNDSSSSSPLVLKDSIILKGHLKEVCSAKWTSNGSKKMMVVTASFDGTIRFWDPLKGASANFVCDSSASGAGTNNGQQPIYALEPHPKKDSIVACGSLDGLLMVWNCDNLIFSYRSPNYKGGIVDISWKNDDCENDILAVCTSDGGKFVISL